MALASDNAGTALPDPITLNSAGRPQTSGLTETGIYLSQPRSYKFILYASGTGNTCNGANVGAQVWSQDNIVAGLSLNPICDSTIAPCTTDVTGSTITAVATTSTLTLANASANASLLQMSVNGTPVANISASRSGSGTYPPLTFSTNGSERMRLLTAGAQLMIGATSTDIPLAAGDGGVVIVAGSGGVAYATASTNAATAYFGRASASYMSVDSGKTGSGVALPLVLSINGSESLRVNTSGTVRISNNTSVPAPPAGTTVQVATGTAGTNNIVVDAFAGVPTLLLRMAGGTVGAPVAVTSGSSLGAVTVTGYGTSGYSSGIRGTVSFLTTETWTDAAQGTTIQFSATTTGSASGGLRMSVLDGLVVGSSGAASLDPGVGGIRVTGAAVFTGLGSASTGDYVCFNTVNSNFTQGTAPCTSSSERFKHDIQYDAIPGLELVAKLRPIRFVRNDHPEMGEQYGFKAEDVALIEPRLVNVDREGKPQGVLYMNLTAILSRAIQELEERLKRLETH